MRIRLIVAQYKEMYEGELMPNIVDAWDEYALEDNGVGYDEALAKHKAREGADYEWVRELDVTVPDDVIDSLAAVPMVSTIWKQA